jgi:outer membrane protein TolC
MMSSIHEPTPEFARYLEWQVTTALRRQDRFARPARTGYRRYVGAVAVIVASMMAGAAGLAASNRIQENQQKQLLVVQEQSEVQLAQMQVAIAQKSAKDAKDRAAIGVISSDDAAAAERALQMAAANLQRARLNLEEVERSGQPVQDDITSPVVGGQDFVAARLNLDQQAAALAAEGAQKHLRDARDRTDVGLGTQVELLDAQADAVRAAGQMETVRQKIALRRQFLAGTITAKEATQQRLLLAARTQLRTAQIDMQVASKRYAWVQAQHQIGAATEVDVLKAQLDMLTRKNDLDVLRAHIAALEHGGALAPDEPGGGG